MLHQEALHQGQDEDGGELAGFAVLFVEGLVANEGQTCEGALYDDIRNNLLHKLLNFKLLSVDFWYNRLVIVVVLSSLDFLFVLQDIMDGHYNGTCLYDSDKGEHEMDHYYGG